MTDTTKWTQKTHNTLMAGLVAATLGAAAMASPAAAGGSLSFSITPNNAEDARAMRTGMQVYSLFNGARNGGSIRQNGRNNEAGLGQNGHGNVGIVHQEGDGHSGTVQQNGNHNAYGLFQFGENTDGHVVQNGNGQTGATFQFGW